MSSLPSIYAGPGLKLTDGLAFARQLAARILKAIGLSVNPPSIDAVVTDMDPNTFKESFKVGADQLVDAVKRLAHEGNVRRIIIKHDGRTVAEFPLSIGLVGAVFAPLLAAVGAIAAVVTDCTIEVERTMPPDDKAPPV